MGFFDYFGNKKGEDANLKCPRCRKNMEKFTKEGVTIDKCLSCGGIWLDAGEVELINKRLYEGPSEKKTETSFKSKIKK